MKMIATLGVTLALVTGGVLAIQAERGPSRAAETPAADAAPAATADTAPAATAATAPAPDAATPVSGEQAFNTECSACHMAYPPGLLPARSWQAITGDLSNHFGEDASLDPATTQAIADYLVAHAAETTRQAQWLLSGIGSNKVPRRITEMPWWRRVHNEVPDRVFARKDIMTKSNCLGCHSGGASGESGESGEMEND
jgi:mono/diheme cytochrome c family protein